MKINNQINSQEYTSLLTDLKHCVTQSQQKAIISVNRELILLYYQIGTSIIQSQNHNGWGAKVIDQLSSDLRSAFPHMKGFSPRNLKYMRKFAQEYPDMAIVQQAAAQLPWGHNMLLLDKFKDNKIRVFYMKKAIEYRWSRRHMCAQMDLELHKRQGQAVTNFKEKLPTIQSDLAHQVLKDPYVFDFLNMGEKANERGVENALCSQMEKFLLELGSGFAFVGKQYHIQVADQDFYIDLLFYHIRLRCFVVIELKDKEFKPEYAGKMNFYLSAVDELVKHDSDTTSIGLILCKTKNNVLAEYTLRDMSKPIGLAEYKLKDALPEAIKTAMPTIEELEKELMKHE